MPPHRPNDERFWEKVDKNGPVVRDGLTPCWIWIGSLGTTGYGQFNFDGRTRKAHRAAFALLGVEPDPKLDLCHRCDNTRCVNPDHLFLGTRQENVDDMKAKDRGPRGERAGNAVLTDAAVVEIRRRCAAGEKQKDVGADYGVGQDSVSLIVNRKQWAHVP